MEFYLSDEKKRLQFPLNPERVTAVTGAQTHSFEVPHLGEIRFPRGTQPARISWSGRLLGEARRGTIPMPAWLPPAEVLDILQGWRNTNARLTLLITETPINLEVFIESLEHSWSGGYGDCEYGLDLVQHRSVVVYTDEEWHQQGATTKNTSAPNAARAALPSTKTYVVARGDTLWAIAKRTLGAGERWREIWEANRAVIGSDPNVILPGAQLVIPGRQGAVV